MGGVWGFVGRCLGVCWVVFRGLLCDASGFVWWCLGLCWVFLVVFRGLCWVIIRILLGDFGGCVHVVGDAWGLLGGIWGFVIVHTNQIQWSQLIIALCVGVFIHAI